MISYGLLGGGKYVSVCKTCCKLGGPGGHAPPGNFDFGAFIRRNWWNLGLFHTNIIYHVLCH